MKYEIINLNLEPKRANFNNNIEFYNCSILKDLFYLDIYLYWVNFDFLFFSAVGVCVLPDVHSKDKSHIPFSPDNVNHNIVRECQQLSSPVNSISPSPIEENKIVLEEQSTNEEIGLMEKIKGNTLTTRFILLYCTSISFEFY